MAHDRNKTLGEAGADNPLWLFSLAVYAQPGVEAECLGLQDVHAIDVNVLLFGAWAGARAGHRLTEPELIRAQEAVATWSRDVVAPLRAARRAAKALEVPSLARQIAAAELGAERVSQDRLHALAVRLAWVGGDDPAGSVRCNIEALLAATGARGAPYPHALAAAALAYEEGPA